MTPETPEPRPRFSYLGGPDIAAICGKNPYAGPYDVWLRKVEKLEVELTPPMDWGLRLERPVADKWADERGLSLIPGRQIIHPEFPFLGGTPDFFCRELPKLLLEIKTATEEKLYQCDEEGTPLWGEPGTDHVPMDYLIQVQYYLGLTGCTRAELAVFFLGPRREFRIYSIEFDPEFYSILLERGKKFWETYVIPGIEPPLDAAPSDLVLEYLAKKALKGAQKAEIPANLIPVALQLEEVGFQRQEMERQEDELKAILLANMAENGVQKYTGKMMGVGFSLGIIGSDEDEGKPITRWDWVAEELAKRLGYSEIPKTLISEKTITGKPRRPYLRPFFNAVRRKRNEPTLAELPTTQENAQ